MDVFGLFEVLLELRSIFFGPCGGGSSGGLSALGEEVDEILGLLTGGAIDQVG